MKTMQMIKNFRSYHSHVPFIKRYIYTYTELTNELAHLQVLYNCPQQKKLRPLCDALVGFNIFSLIFKKNTSTADFRFFQMILTYLKKIIDYNIKFS